MKPVIGGVATDIGFNGALKKSVAFSRHASMSLTRIRLFDVHIHDRDLEKDNDKIVYPRNITAQSVGS